MIDPQNEQGLVRRVSPPIAGRRIGSDASGPHQGESTDPIVEQPHLPRMAEAEPLQQLVGGVTRLMDDPAASGGIGGGRGQMSPVPAELRAALPTDGGYAPQQPVSAVPTAAAEGAGYLRLQLRVDNGEMSLVGVSRVSGPLSQPGPVHGGLAYEVSLGQRQLGAGDVPDPGVRRGLHPPDRPESGHAVVELPSYEFTARVPADQVSAVNLPDLHVAVYKLDSGQATRLTADRPLLAQVGRTAEEVASLRGVHVEQLPHDVRAGLERALLG
jgi:hypothetical protein